MSLEETNKEKDLREKIWQILKNKNKTLAIARIRVVCIL